VRLAAIHVNVAPFNLGELTPPQTGARRYEVKNRALSRNADRFLKSETKSDLMANTLDNRRSCRHTPSNQMHMTAHRIGSAACACLFALSLAQTALGRDAARDLQRMVGFTIVMAASVSEVRSSGTDMYLKLDDGMVLKTSDMLLEPLPLTDIILFAKPPSKEIFDKFGGKLPKEKLFEFKVLIDNEAYDTEVVYRGGNG
jgi:hypothetical protein